MRTEFLARFGYAQDDGEILMVGLADDQFEPETYIILQKSLHSSGADIELGHDQIHMTFAGQHRAVYGGLEAVEISPDGVRLKITPDSAEKLKAETEIFVRCDLLGATVQDIVRLLQAMAGELVSDKRGSF